MKFKGLSASAPACLVALSLAGVAAMPMAAEVQSSGTLELTISGFVDVLAHGGALDDQLQDPDASTELDFSTDVELNLLLEAEDEETGLEYGGSIDLEADTSSEENGAESWLYASGGWGEVRLGDVDGPVAESSLGASTVAAGTGGIDGDIIEEIAVDAISPSDTDVATKIRYYTPLFGGFQAGVSYTPDAEGFGDSLATTDLAVGHWVEGALTYESEGEAFSVLASVVSSWGQVENRESDFFDADAEEGEVWTYYAGATVEAFGVSAGAGFGDESVGGFQKRYFNVGLGTELGPVAVSVNHGRALRTRNYPGVGEPWNLVFSADRELVPGVGLAGDVAYFDNDLDRGAREPTGGDSGWVWVTRLELVF